MTKRLLCIMVVSGMLAAASLSEAEAPAKQSSPGISQAQSEPSQKDVSAGIPAQAASSQDLSRISDEDLFRMMGIEPPLGLSGLDTSIPRSGVQNPDAMAVVIGNSKYSKAKSVDYAYNDARLINNYLIDAMGYKEGNIFFVENATKAEMEMLFGNKDSHKGKLFNAIKEGRSDVFVYYSGHGAPGLKDKKGYFVPVEADPNYLELSGYPADVFYQNLSKLPARSITVVLDACFSGASVFENISPMVLEIEKPVVNINNAVVFSSSSGSQVSSWYNEKAHGMFTYFFVKAIHDRNGDADKDGVLTFDEVYRYISDKSEGVPYYARRIHGIDQTPTIEGQYQGRVMVRY